MKNKFGFVFISGLCHAIPLIIPISFIRIVCLLGITSATCLWIFEGANPY